MIKQSTVTVPKESRKRLDSHPYFREHSDKPGFVIYEIRHCLDADNHEEYTDMYNKSIEIVRQMGIPAVFIPESLFQPVVSLKYTETGEIDMCEISLESYINGHLDSWRTLQDEKHFKRFLEHIYLWENQVRYGNIHTLKHFME